MSYMCVSCICVIKEDDDAHGTRKTLADPYSGGARNPGTLGSKTEVGISLGAARQDRDGLCTRKIEHGGGR